MSPEAQYRTDLPRDAWGRETTITPCAHPSPQAPDNAAQERVVLYGPRGEALIRQVPRRAGFRPPNGDAA